jgi:hypothetical protein
MLEMGLPPSVVSGTAAYMLFWCVFLRHFPVFVSQFPVFMTCYYVFLGQFTVFVCMIGGGVLKGPIMLEMGLPPSVVSATAAYMLFWCVYQVYFHTADLEGFFLNNPQVNHP